MHDIIYGNCNIKNLLSALRKQVKKDIDDNAIEAYWREQEFGDVGPDLTVDEVINNMTNVELITKLDEVLRSGDIETIIGDDSW